MLHAEQAKSGKITGRGLLELMLIAVAGLACVLIAGLATGAKPAAAPLFPMLRGAVEGLNGGAPALVFMLGLAAGMTTGQPAARVGLASVALLPLAAFAEMVADRTSHNLIPFELVVYLVLSLPGMIGAGLGSRAVRWFGAERARSSSDAHER